MQDFLLEFRSVWGHLSEGDYLEFKELRGDKIFMASDFVLLGFLNFLGYRLDGWDLEYWVEAGDDDDGGILEYEINGCICRHCINDHYYGGYCNITSGCNVVDFSGMLFSEYMFVYGANIERCVVPIDVFFYFAKMPYVKLGRRGERGFSVRESARDVVYDFSLCDAYDVNIDFTRVYVWMYSWKGLIFSFRYLYWFLLDFCFNRWCDSDKLEFSGFHLKVLNVNTAFLPSVLSRVVDVCGPDYAECLHEALRGVL